MVGTAQDNQNSPVNFHAVQSDPQRLANFRSPPHNFEAEKALLGAMFANNNAYDRVSGYLRPEHFADPIHGKFLMQHLSLLNAGK
jgi:replicative DNA helicase